MEWITKIDPANVEDLKSNIRDRAKCVFATDSSKYTTCMDLLDEPEINMDAILILFQGVASGELAFEVGVEKNNAKRPVKGDTFKLTQNNLLLFVCIDLLSAWKKRVNISDKVSYIMARDGLLFGRLFFDVDIHETEIDSDNDFDNTELMLEICREIEREVGSPLELAITKSSLSRSFHIISHINFDLVTKRNIEENIRLWFQNTHNGCCILDDVPIYKISVSKHHVHYLYANRNLNEIENYNWIVHMRSFPIDLDFSASIYSKLDFLASYSQNNNLDMYIERDGTKLPIVYNAKQQMLKFEHLLSDGDEAHLDRGMLNLRIIQSVYSNFSNFFSNQMMGSGTTETYENLHIYNEPYQVVFNNRIKYKKPISEIFDIDVEKVLQSIRGDSNDVSSINNIDYSKSDGNDSYEELFKEWDVDIDKDINEQCIDRGKNLERDLYESSLEKICDAIIVECGEDLLKNCLTYYDALFDDFSLYKIAEFIIASLIKECHYTTALSLVLKNIIWEMHKLYNAVSFLYRVMTESGIESVNARYVYTTMLKQNEYQEALLFNLTTIFRPHIVYFLLKFKPYDSTDHKQTIFSSVYPAKKNFDDMGGPPPAKKSKKPRSSPEDTENFEIDFYTHAMCLKNMYHLTVVYDQGKYRELIKDDRFIKKFISQLCVLPLEPLNCRYWIHTYYGIYNPIFGLEPSSPHLVSRLYIKQFENKNDIFKFFDWNFKNVLINVWLRAYHFPEFLDCHKMNTILLAPLEYSRPDLDYPEKMRKFFVDKTDFVKCKLMPEIQQNMKDYPNLNKMFLWVYLLVCEISKNTKFDISHPRTLFHLLYPFNAEMMINLKKINLEVFLDDGDCNTFMATLERAIDEYRYGRQQNRPIVDVGNLSTTIIHTVSDKASKEFDPEVLEKVPNPHINLSIELIPENVFVGVLSLLSWLIRAEISEAYKETKFFVMINEQSAVVYEELKSILSKFNGPFFLAHFDRNHMGLYLREFCKNTSLEVYDHFKIKLPHRYKILDVIDCDELDIYSGIATLLCHAQFDQETFVELTKDLISFVYPTNFNRSSLLLFGRPATGKDALMALLESMFKGDQIQNISGLLTNSVDKDGNSLAEPLNGNVFAFANEVQRLNITFNQLSDQGVLTHRAKFKGAKVESTINAHLILMSNTAPHCPNMAVISRLRPYERSFRYIQYNVEAFARKPNFSEERAYINDNFAFQLILKYLPAHRDKMTGGRGLGNLFWLASDFFFRNLQKPISIINTKTMDSHLKILNQQVSHAQYILDRKFIVESKDLISYDVFCQKIINILARDLNVSKSSRETIKAVLLELDSHVSIYKVNNLISLDVVG